MTEQDKRNPARDEAGPADDSPDLAHGRAMPDAGEPVPGQDKSNLAGEMEKMEYEPLLPIEKKLILWSIGLGVVLLVLLTWVSYTFFPAS